MKFLKWTTRRSWLARGEMALALLKVMLITKSLSLNESGTHVKLSYDISNGVPSELYKCLSSAG